MKKTSRGFKIYSEIKDSYQNQITVQESSAATRSCCWIFVRNEEGSQCKFHMGEWHAATAHLTVPQAKRVAKALMKFVEEASK